MEISAGISQYPDLQIKPVILTPEDEAFQKMRRKDKRIFMIQAYLFGRDLLTD